jgi:hypothetical protein
MEVLDGIKNCRNLGVNKGQNFVGGAWENVGRASFYAY